MAPTTQPEPQTYDHLEDAVAAAREAYQSAHDQGAASALASCADYYGWHAAVKAAVDVVLAEHRERLVKAVAEATAMRDAKVLPQMPAGGYDNYGGNRLAGKIQGAQLALSYLDEITR